MEAIYKLNDILKYSIQVNNRNVVAAICAQELNHVLQSTNNYSDKKLVESLIQFCTREMNSTVPMKLFQLNELISIPSTYRKTSTKVVINNNNNSGNNGDGDDNSTSVDLSNYYTRREIDVLLSRKQNELTAGDHIELENDIISVDLSDIEGGEPIDVYNEYGDSTTGAISQDFFTDKVQANATGIQTVTENVKVISDEMKTVNAEVQAMNQDIKQIEENVKTYDDDIAALEAAVFPLTIQYLRGGAIYEKGSSHTVAVTWDYDREVDNQYLNGINLNKDVRSKIYNNVNSDITYTLTATESGQNVSANTSVKFELKKYWGTSKNRTLTDSEILSLRSDWAKREMNSTQFDCTGGKYAYYIIPTSIKNDIEFWVNGLQNTDWNEEELSLTNASGYTENYTIFRLNTIQTGVLKIEVK